MAVWGRMTATRTVFATPSTTLVAGSGRECAFRDCCSREVAELVASCANWHELEKNNDLVSLIIATYPIWDRGLRSCRCAWIQSVNQFNSRQRLCVGLGGATTDWLHWIIGVSLGEYSFWVSR